MVTIYPGPESPESNVNQRWMEKCGETRECTVWRPPHIGKTLDWVLAGVRGECMRHCPPVKGCGLYDDVSGSPRVFGDEGSAGGKQDTKWWSSF